MLSSPIVNTAISVLFIIFVFSMMASLALEYLNKLTKNRGKFLLSCLSQNLRDEYINQVDFSLLVYSHPLVSGLKEDKNNIPSYIAADVFATALIDVIINYGITYTFEFDNQDAEGKPTTAIANWADSDPLTNFNRSLSIIKPSGVRTLFETFAVNAKTYNDLKQNIMVWYDHYMDRVTGWYKKSIGRTMFWISVVITLVFNVDTIHILKSLQDNAVLNSYIAASAQNYVAANKNTNFDTVSLSQVRALGEMADSLGIPVGYKFKGPTIDSIEKAKIMQSGGTSKKHPLDFAPSWSVFRDTLADQAENDGGFLMLLLGWLISVIAISKGAPFWFDMLSKLVNLRLAGSKPTSTTTNKKDADG